VLSPDEEKERLKKRRVKVDRSKIPKRPNFADEAVRDYGYVPAPGQYKPISPLQARVKGSVAMKNE